MVSKENLKTIRKKLKNVGKDQKILTKVAKESVSIPNVMRLEIVKNRASINWLINNMLISHFILALAFIL